VVGNGGHVAHRDNGAGTGQFRGAGVSTLAQFAGRAALKVENGRRTRTPEETARAAEAEVAQRPDGYHPLADNCEHFASRAASGESVSHQVDQASLARRAAVSLADLASVPMGMFLNGVRAAQKRKR